MLVESVKVVEKKVTRNGKTYTSYMIAIPKKLAKQLNLKKGDLLLVEITEYKNRKALVYYPAT